MTRPNPFAAAADRYAQGRPYHHARTLRRALAGWTPRLALDVACGTGLSTRGLVELGLVELGIAAVGVDVAPAMVARARADTGRPYAVAAAEALPLGAGCVDLVTVGSGVHWFDQRRFAAEAARVLRPGGALLLYEHAGGTLPEPAFLDWMRGTYLNRFPSPPRGALATEFPATDVLVPERADQWPDEVAMTRRQFAAYLTTQSNVAGEPADRVRGWFEAELAPFFEHEQGRVVRFRRSCRLLRRGAGERGREAARGAGAGACAG